MTPSTLVLPGAIVALTLFASPSFSHDFWINHGSYKSPKDGSHCCGANDCFMVPASDMQPTAAGWRRWRPAWATSRRGRRSVPP